jgi:hypothetical protein
MDPPLLLLLVLLLYFPALLLLLHLLLFHLPHMLLMWGSPSPAPKRPLLHTATYKPENLLRALMPGYYELPRNPPLPLYQHQPYHDQQEQQQGQQQQHPMQVKRTAHLRLPCWALPAHAHSSVYSKILLVGNPTAGAAVASDTAAAAALPVHFQLHDHALKLKLPPLLL